MARHGSLYTIAPHGRFLSTLAQALLDGQLVPEWPREGPFWLSDITIFLPTRRARTVLIEALRAQLADNPMLLPDIRALGGDDPDAEPFLPPFDSPPPKPAIGALKRRLILSQLTEKWLALQTDAPFSAPALGGYRGAPSSAEVIALADSLAQLIDDFTIAGIELSALEAIEDAQLPARWQENLGFVRFILEHWPSILADMDVIDGVERTNQLLARQVEALPLLFANKPVIIAGSTGSIPATANLIAAIADLKFGAVVLPGLDRNLNAAQCEALADSARHPHGHPQYGLMRLLRHLKAKPEDVEELAGQKEIRTSALQAALDLPAETAAWPAKIAALEIKALERAAQPISLVVARTPELEARAVALAACEGLQSGKSVALIVPDQVLSRRIAAELSRFDVAVDDAAGTPLARSRAGRLVRQIVSVLANGLSAVDVMALLRNRNVVLGLQRHRLGETANWLDFSVFRSGRLAPGFDGIRRAVDTNLAERPRHAPLRLSPQQAEAVHALLDALETALAPISTLFTQDRFSAAQFALALQTCLEAVRAPAEGDGLARLEGEVELGLWLAELANLSGLGPQFSVAGLASALDGLMAGRSVRPPQPEQSAIALFGRLEARLMDADLVVMAGLVEGAWPEVADPGPWMSRGMRMAVGLEPPEKLHGLAAHDFYMAAGADQLIISYAERSGTSPANPSRLVQRLEAFFGNEISKWMRERGDVWIKRAYRLDAVVGLPQPASRPAPRPPAHRRPDTLSITEAEILLRSPYDLYAKYVLGLRAVAALGADPDAAERGTIIHDILGDFLKQGGQPLAPDAHERLMALAHERFASLEAIPERRDIWLMRFDHIAQRYIAYETERDGTIVSRHAEIGGKMTFEISGKPFTLRGRVDRIDVLMSDALEIIDFKTGSPPPAKDIKALYAPQLPLEAVMARNGAFADIIAAPSDALTYIKISNGPDAFKPTELAFGAMSLEAGIDAVFRHFQNHVASILQSDTHPMAARVMPRKGQRFKGDYDHLARTGEWSLLGDSEDDE
ncbi:double-strand break repair protein AddB [Pelagibacterium lentulum]|nr:double-strand break repair protein AddB [Pelagibacterium lentulum]